MVKRLATVTVALVLGLTGCGDAEPGSDNTGQPTPETDDSNGGSLVSTPENMRQGGADN